MVEFPRQKGLCGRVTRTFQAEEVAYAKGGSMGGCGMFGELQIVLCGGVVGEEAGKAGLPEPGFVSPSATHMISGRLPTWVLAPTQA